jgi:hypothetical protein
LQSTVRLIEGCFMKVTTPFLRRYILALPEYRSIDFLGIIDAENLPRLQQWIKVMVLLRA